MHLLACSRPTRCPLALVLLALLVPALLALPGCAPEGDVPADAYPAPRGEPPVPLSLGDSTASGLPDAVPQAGPVPAPDFTLPALAGDSLRLSDYRGRVVLLNFWATWCPPCRAEIPDLNTLYADLQGEGLTIIGVSEDEEGMDVVRPFAKEYAIRYPVVVDDGSVAAAFGGVWGLPTTFVIDRDGEVVGRIVGLLPVDEMRPELEAMLKGAAS